MSAALVSLLLVSLFGCFTLTTLVVNRKFRRDRSQARSTARRAGMRSCVLGSNAEELRACLLEAVSDLDAQVDVAVTLDMTRDALDPSQLDRLHEAATSIGLDAKLRQQTTHRSSMARGRAALLLSRLRIPDTAGAIAALLRDSDADVRLTAVGALAAVADDSSAREMIAALRAEALPAERINERLGAAWAVNAILAALDEEYRAPARHLVFGRSIRAHLAIALGLAAQSQAEPALLRLLACGDPEERVAAARALGQAGTLLSSPALQRAMADPEWLVRAQAAKALGLLGDPAAVSVLEGALSDPAWWVRSNSATSLLALGAAGLDGLRRATESGDQFARDRAREALDFVAMRERTAP